MSELRKYIIYFTVASGEDGFEVPEVELAAEYHEQSFIGLQQFTPAHEPYEYITGETAPTWGEVQAHEEEWESYLCDEVLDPLADDFGDALKEIMIYAKDTKNDMRKLVTLLRQLNDGVIDKAKL